MINPNSAENIELRFEYDEKTMKLKDKGFPDTDKEKKEEKK